jgi:hypothetical protein
MEKASRPPLPLLYVMLLKFDFTQAQGNHSLDTVFMVITLQTDSTDFWFQIGFL